MDSELFETFLVDNIIPEDREHYSAIMFYVREYEQQLKESTSEHYWDCKCWRCR